MTWSRNSKQRLNEQNKHWSTKYYIVKQKYMGTAQLAFAGVLWGGATGSDATGSDMTGSDVSHVTGSDNIRKYVLRMRNRKLHNIALIGPFDRKWQSHVTVRGHVRKRSWPEVGFAHARLFPAFFFLFLSSSTMATEGHLIPSGFPWVYATEVTQHPQWPKVTWSLGSVLGVFSTTSASYNPRKPRILYLVTGTSPGCLPPPSFPPPSPSFPPSSSSSSSSSSWNSFFG